MTLTPISNPFSHLEMSKNADSIYYADLFKINNISAGFPSPADEYMETLRML